MLDQGITQLVQSTPAVVAIARLGGFIPELPKDMDLPSWSMIGAGGLPNTGLLFTRGAGMRRVQIDAFGNTMDEAIRLSSAIDVVLQGFSGTLPDPDSTIVSSCLASDEPEHYFDDARRTYRCRREYEIIYSYS